MTGFLCVSAQPEITFEIKWKFNSQSVRIAVLIQTVMFYLPLYPSVSVVNTLFIKVNQITSVNNSEQHSVISLINHSLHHTNHELLAQRRLNVGPVS